MLEGDHLAIDQVLETTRRGHHDVRIPGPAGLALDANASVNGGDLQRAGVNDGQELVDDLGGEFPGGREHEGGGAAVVRLDAVGERNAEGERLARAGRGLREHVVTGEHVRDHKLLHSEWGLDAAARKGGDHRFRHAEIGEVLR